MKCDSLDGTKWRFLRPDLEYENPDHKEHLRTSRVGFEFDSDFDSSVQDRFQEALVNRISQKHILTNEISEETTEAETKILKQTQDYIRALDNLETRVEDEPMSTTALELLEEEMFPTDRRDTESNWDSHSEYKSEDSRSKSQSSDEFAEDDRDVITWRPSQRVKLATHVGEECTHPKKNRATTSRQISKARWNYATRTGGKKAKKPVKYRSHWYLKPKYRRVIKDDLDKEKSAGPWLMTEVSNDEEQRELQKKIKGLFISRAYKQYILNTKTPLPHYL